MRFQKTIHGKNNKKEAGWLSHSTGPPRGNQVDGLPRVCRTETVGQEKKKGPAINSTTLSEIGRFSKVLLDGIAKSAQKNVVERIMEININVFKGRKCNASTVPMRSQISKIPCKNKGNFKGKPKS